MGNHHRDEDRQSLVDRLLRKLHEQSVTSPEPTPFWREGRWRCEFHRRPGDHRLKLFSGSRCVHEERVDSTAVASLRSGELRREIVENRRSRSFD